LSSVKVGIIGFRGFVGSAIYNCFAEDKRYETTGIEKDSYGQLKGGEFHLLINANGNSNKPLADKNPQPDFEMNVTNTLHFLHDFSYSHFLHISTADVYPDKTKPQNTLEDTPVNPHSLSNYGFSKYLGELMVKQHAKSWLILRLAGMVGKGVKKGAMYDVLALQKLFVSPQCKYHCMDTADVARIAKALYEKEKWGEIYNVVGKGSIELCEYAKLAGVQLKETGTSLAVFNVSTQKLEKELEVPSSLQAAKNFVAVWRSKK